MVRMTQRNECTGIQKMELMFVVVSPVYEWVVGGKKMYEIHVEVFKRATTNFPLTKFYKIYTKSVRKKKSL